MRKKSIVKQSLLLLPVPARVFSSQDLPVQNPNLIRGTINDAFTDNPIPGVGMVMKGTATAPPFNV